MSTYVWPVWVTKATDRRLRDLALSFSWMTFPEPSELSPSVWGQWDRGAEAEEINVALREVGVSLVGIFPRGKGFWGGRAVPALLTPQTVFVGPLDEVLDVAVQWAADRQDARCERLHRGGPR